MWARRIITLAKLMHVQVDDVTCITLPPTMTSMEAFQNVIVAVQTVYRYSCFLCLCKTVQAICLVVLFFSDRNDLQ